MKIEQLTKLISKHLNLRVELIYSYPAYDAVKLLLPGGGHVKIGVEPKQRGVIPFLFFNFFDTDLRIPSSKGRAKYNYFGDGQETELERLLIELKSML